MSRRARKGRGKNNSNPIPILIGIGIAIVVAAGFYIIKGVIGEADGETAPPLDLNSYFNSSKSHQGNRVMVTGTIKSRTPLKDNRTLLSIDAEGVKSIDKPLGIIVTQEVMDKYKMFNLEISNKYVFICKAERDDFLYAEIIKSK